MEDLELLGVRIRRTTKIMAARNAKLKKIQAELVSLKSAMAHELEMAAVDSAELREYKRRLDAAKAEMGNPE